MNVPCVCRIVRLKSRCLDPLGPTPGQHRANTCFCAGVRLGQYWCWGECWPLFLCVFQQKCSNVNPPALFLQRPLSYPRHSLPTMWAVGFRPAAAWAARRRADLWSWRSFLSPPASQPGSGSDQGARASCLQRVRRTGGRFGRSDCRWLSRCQQAQRRRSYIHQKVKSGT